MKARKTTDGKVIFWCPGCEGYHGVSVEPFPGAERPIWSWNGNLETPTFTPSILVFEGHNHPRCHSYVRDGMIEFLADCGHKLAGQTVPLPEDD